MAEKVSKWVKFKKFLKRNMTPTWAKHISYQIFAFVVAVLMVIGVADYAVTKTYEEMKLSFVDGFTVTAHTGSFNTPMNSMECIKKSIENKVDIIEVDVRQRPDGTIVMAHDLVVTNNDGVALEDALILIKDTDIRINLDIKETRTLDGLYELLSKYDLTQQSFLTGIDTLDIKDVKASKCSNMEYYLNYYPSRPKVFYDDYRVKLIDMLDETGAVGLNCNYRFVNSQLSNLLHSKGYKLSVWTVDKERTAKKMLVVKPDNITTKNPEMIKDVIDNWDK